MGRSARWRITSRGFAATARRLRDSGASLEFVMCSPRFRRIGKTPVHVSIVPISWLMHRPYTRSISISRQCRRPRAYTANNNRIRFVKSLSRSCHIAFVRATAARPSVCPSVTRVDQSKTVEVRIMQFSPYGITDYIKCSPMHVPLVFAG